MSSPALLNPLYLIMSIIFVHFPPNSYFTFIYLYNLHMLSYTSFTCSSGFCFDQHFFSIYSSSVRVSLLSSFFLLIYTSPISSTCVICICFPTPPSHLSRLSSSVAIFFTHLPISAPLYLLVSFMHPYYLSISLYAIQNSPFLFLPYVSV